MLKKTTFREIRNSLGRYFAIMAIVALGVGFFSGLKVTREAMVTTTNDYLQEENMFDYKLLSTLGFEKSDVKAITNVKEVAAAEGGISSDALVHFQGENQDNVFKFHSLTNKVNKLTLSAGRLPKKDNECLLDHKYSDDYIGKTIIVSDSNKKSTKELLKYRKYKVVGTVVSPEYLNFERGTTSLGNGSVSGFIILKESGFDSDYYTEIFASLKEKHTIYSDEYEDYIDKVTPILEKATKKRANLRFENIKSDAMDEWQDGKDEYDKNLAKYESEKTDTKAKLAKSYKDIKDGKAKLSQEEKNLDKTEKELKSSKKQLKSGISKVNSGIKKLNKGITDVKDGIKDVKAGIAFATAYDQDHRKLDVQLSTLNAQLQVLEGQLSGLQTQKKTLEGQLSKVNSGLSKIKTGRTQIATSKKKLNDGLKEYSEGKAKANREFEKAEKKLNDAKADLDDALEEINDIKKPETFVLDRNTNVGYACFESDSSIVDGIATVLPVFFFLVAALVCMTTMTRMVDEQRTQIGVLKALGYSNMAVMRKYLFYSGSAAFIGAVIGFFAGSYIFPNVIWIAYGMMYDFNSKLQYVVNVPLGLSTLAVSLICSCGATILSCYNEFREVPAELIRPKAPKSGKRILLERIPFIWNKLGFLYKVSFRNIFRYKKRFFMMVVGISGCTALLVAGFGIKDSIKNVVDYQYNEIHTFQYSVNFDKNMTASKQDKFCKETEGFVDDVKFIHQSSCDALMNGKEKPITLISTTEDKFTDFIDLHNKDFRHIAFPEKGETVICKKLARTYDIKVGDTITLRNDDMQSFDVKVSGICENFINNYIYISDSTFVNGFGKAPTYQSALVKLDTSGITEVDAAKEKIHEVGAKLIDTDAVIQVTITEDMRDRIGTMMESLNYVILLVILSAGALAFIVLYNLTNINITERIREIATIKVLGFRPLETSSYVFRENIFLTGISAICGLGLGRIFLEFIISQINVDLISFDTRITVFGYVMSVVLTFVFAIIVNLVMHRKLQKISMTESLKSIE